LLTLLVVLLFGLTSSLFNSTIDDNRSDITEWVARIRRRMVPFRAGLQRVTGSIPMADLSRIRGIGRVAVVLALTGLVYGYLSPDFGLSPQGVFLFVSIVIGLGLMTYIGEGGATLLATRRFHAESSVRLYGAAIGVAVACVVMSRLVDFRPGFVYGFVASSLVLGGISLDRRRSAELVILPSVALVVVSLGSWTLLGPISAIARDDGNNWPAALAASVLAITFVAGLEGVFYNMIPLTFMDGAAVYRWNRIAWGLLFGAATFLFWHLVINSYSSYLDAFKQTSVVLALAMLAVYGGLTVATWGFFRIRRRLVEAGA